jgi:hypothetical protein
MKKRILILNHELNWTQLMLGIWMPFCLSPDVSHKSTKCPNVWHDGDIESQIFVRNTILKTRSPG